MAQQVKIDPEAVRALAELLRETDLTEIEYQVDSLRIKVLRSVQQAVVPVSVPAPTVAVPTSSSVLPQSSAIGGIEVATEQKGENLENHPGVIEAQMVGTVYLSPGPDADPFISVGDTVTQGQTLFIIEAMKVMNMIKAPRSGTVKHIFVKDAQPVEYGDPIIIVD
ncbi:MAG: acetyl-CoA carboxylase biotin carboxyl carrier protein [Alphaproteobacteria bacterium]|nr:acetyl-CoA carboxylase biotin carboxyl carrier protein [Alphaproteobacteria bacterium]